MSIALEVRNAKPSKQVVAIKPLWWAKAFVYRFWWHTKAYSSILGILILVFLSMVVLHLQGLIEARKLQTARSNAIEEI